MKQLEIEGLNLNPMTESEMRNTDGGLILIDLNILDDAINLIKFAIGEVVDFFQGVYDGFTHFIK